MWESETESSRRQNTPSGLFFASVELLSDGWHSATHRPRLTESLLNGFNKLFQRQIITEAPEENIFLLCFHWQRGIQEVRLLPITIEFIFGRCVWSRCIVHVSNDLCLPRRKKKKHFGQSLPGEANNHCHIAVVHTHPERQRFFLSLSANSSSVCF